MEGAKISILEFLTFYIFANELDVVANKSRNKFVVESISLAVPLVFGIGVGCIRADYDFQIKVFKNIIDVNKGKPTNSEFIAAVADYVNLRFVVNNNC